MASISNAITAAMEFLTSPVSSYKFRKSIQDESLERTLTDVIKQRSILQGIIVSDGDQSTDNTISQEAQLDGKQTGVYRAAKVRILGIHDMILPDPVAFFKQKKTYNQIERLIECHPIIYSKNKVEGGTSLNRGSIVEIEFVDGIPRFTPTGGSNSDYFRISIPPEASLNTKPSGPAQAAFDNQSEIVTMEDITVPVGWKLSTKLTNQGKTATPAMISFLDSFARNLQTYTEFKGYEVVVTSVQRTIREQAIVVVNGVDSNANWWPYKKPYWKPFREAAKSDQTRENRIQKLEELIRNAITNDNRYMSEHLRAGAMDLRTKNILGGDVATKLAKFKKAAEDTKLAKSIQIEYYEETTFRDQKAKRDAEGTPAKNEHMHLNLLQSTAGE